MKWVKIPGIEHVDRPFIKKVKAGTKSICLVGYDREIFALSARCPHAGGDLSQGWCNNAKLICPVHRYSYDLHSGKGVQAKMITLTLSRLKLKMMLYLSALAVSGKD